MPEAIPPIPPALVNGGGPDGAAVAGDKTETYGRTLHSEGNPVLAEPLSNCVEIPSGSLIDQAA